MSSAGPTEYGSDAPEATRALTSRLAASREHKTAGAWAGYLIFALILLYLIVIDAQAGYEREWARVTGITVFTLAFVIVPPADCDGFVPSGPGSRRAAARASKSADLRSS
jgi:hypothetical protein